MSQSYPFRQVIRCPLCTDSRQPAHIGQGAFICEHCGQYFRVVHATPTRTGAALSEIVKSKVKFGPNKGDVNRK